MAKVISSNAIHATAAEEAGRNLAALCRELAAEISAANQRGETAYVSEHVSKFRHAGQFYGFAPYSRVDSLACRPRTFGGFFSSDDPALLAKLDEYIFRGKVQAKKFVPQASPAKAAK